MIFISQSETRALTGKRFFFANVTFCLQGQCVLVDVEIALIWLPIDETGDDGIDVDVSEPGDAGSSDCEQTAGDCSSLHGVHGSGLAKPNG